MARWHPSGVDSGGTREPRSCRSRARSTDSATSRRRHDAARPPPASRVRGRGRRRRRLPLHLHERRLPPAARRRRRDAATCARSFPRNALVAHVRAFARAARETHDRSRSRPSGVATIPTPPRRGRRHPDHRTTTARASSSSAPRTTSASTAASRPSSRTARATIRSPSCPNRVMLVEWLQDALAGAHRRRASSVWCCSTSTTSRS